jgi:hypothetical protein
MITPDQNPIQVPDCVGPMPEFFIRPNWGDTHWVGYGGVTVFPVFLASAPEPIKCMSIYAKHRQLGMVQLRQLATFVLN